MGKFTVYMHITKTGKRYIGLTSRKVEYRWNNGKAYKSNKHFYNAILRDGWNNIEHCIVAEGLSKEQACILEQELIKKYDTINPLKGYNNSLGGDGGTLGYKWSEEQIENRKKSRVYGSSWAKGKTFSDEHKRKIGDAHKGLQHTKEAKEKMRKAHLGIVPSWAGKTRDDKYRASKSKPVMCIETEVVYFGLMEAERQTGIHHSNICNCLKGLRASAGGYHWKYIDKKERESK